MNGTTFNDPELPLTPVSRSRHFLKSNIIKNGASWRQSYHCTRGNYT